jgi:hypothetical protein
MSGEAKPFRGNLERSGALSTLRKFHGEKWFSNQNLGLMQLIW